MLRESWLGSLSKYQDDYANMPKYIPKIVFIIFQFLFDWEIEAQWSKLICLTLSCEFLRDLGIPVLGFEHPNIFSYPLFHILCLKTCQIGFSPLWRCTARAQFDCVNLSEWVKYDYCCFLSTVRVFTSGLDMFCLYQCSFSVKTSE